MHPPSEEMQCTRIRVKLSRCRRRFAKQTHKKGTEHTRARTYLDHVGYILQRSAAAGAAVAQQRLCERKFFEI